MHACVWECVFVCIRASISLSCILFVFLICPTPHLDPTSTLPPHSLTNAHLQAVRIFPQSFCCSAFWSPASRYAWIEERNSAEKTSLAGSRFWEISLEGILPDWISTQSNAPFERKKIFLHKTQKYCQHLNQFKTSKNILLYLLRMKCHLHSSGLYNVSIWIGFHSLVILNRLQLAAFSHKILCFEFTFQ